MLWRSLGLFALLGAVVLIRLPGVNDPLYGPHHIRMITTATIARNFHEISMNIFYPRINWGGNGPGIIEEAFQIYAYVVALLYGIFGTHEAIGRALSLTCFTATAYVLFRMTEVLYRRDTAILTLVFFGLSPMGIYYGRAYFPDTLQLFCAVTSLYLFLIWSGGASRSALWGSALALSAAVLTKPSNLYAGLPLLYLCLRRFKWSFLRRWDLWIFTAVVIVPSVFWYFHAHSLWDEYGNTHGMWTLPWLYRKELLWDPHFHWYLTVRSATKITTVIGLPLFVFGFFVKPTKRNYLVHFWMLGFAVSVAMTPGAHLAHDYYQLPLLAIACLLMGAAAALIWRGRVAGTVLPQALTGRILVFVLVFLMAGASFSSLRQNYRMPTDFADASAFALRLSELTEPQSLIALGTSVRRGPGPADETTCRRREPDGRYLGHEGFDFYMSRRKGWSLHYEDWSLELVEQLRSRGANVFATSYAMGMQEKREFIDELAARYTVIEKTPRWAIFSLAR